MKDVIAELTELAAEFATAEFSADVEFFRCHLADGLRFRRASGKVVDKVTFLKDLIAPDSTNERLTAQQIEVLSYGPHLAICSLLVDFKGTRAESRWKACSETLACSFAAKNRGSALFGSIRMNLN